MSETNTVLRACRSPYCECVPGQCTHPGCFDARGTAPEDPATFNAGIFRCSPELFAALLQLPPGSYVDAVWVAQDRPGVVEFRVRGPAWPKVVAGEHIPQVRGEFTQATAPHGMATYSVEWKV